VYEAMIAGVTTRPIRVLIIGSILAIGFGIAVLLLHQSNFMVAIVVFAVSLAGLVGAGKLASP